MPLEGFVEPRKEDLEKYIRMGWWQNITLGDVLDKAAELYPGKMALIDDRNRLTYSELRDRVDRLAIGLMKLGIGRGDCVIVQLPNWGEFIWAFFALHKLGAPAVLLLARHMQVEINYFCALTKAKAWILPERYHHTDYLPVIDDVRKANPQMEHVILVRSEGESPFVTLENLVQDVDPVSSTGQALTDRERAALAGRKPEATEVAFILPTGGTTGLPKAVPRTHNDAVCEAKYKALAREQGTDAICLISTPLEHNLGLASLNSTIHSFGTVVLLDSTRPEDFCATVQRERATCGPLVPTLLERLVEFDRLSEYDMTSVKALYVGGAKTHADVIRAVHKRIGKVYVTAFGMSEGPTCTTRLSDPEDVIFNAIGRPCCPHDEFKVVDEAGTELPPNVEGELLCKGPGVFTGYLNYPEENERAFTTGGFFRTGDLAMIDPAGNVRITGRIKDIIIRGGENISPAEIETLLRLHPDIEAVAVVGMPDPQLGEKACAYIKPRQGTKPTLENVVAFLKSKGASVLQLPERVELIADIPLTKIGKPDKKALQEDIKKRLGYASVK
ncbi:MAG: AMP-binding protein [Chloroflexi bacterium]|nr:AMP-binding protein [Chloroflexota bacterium]